MKKNYGFIAFMAVIMILSSCGGGGTFKTVNLLPVKSGSDFEYVDLTGKIIINPQFANASIFREGLAMVATSGNERKWGFIGEDGKYVIAPTYVRATIFSEDLAWVVSENSSPMAIDTKGKIQFNMSNAEVVRIFHGGFAAFSLKGDDGIAKWGFVDKTGKVIINPQFSDVGDFFDGKCAFANGEGKWGFIDKNGKIIINPQFDNADRFYNGRAIVKLGEKSGLIDDKGKYLINPQFKDMSADGDMFLIEQEGKFGWADKNGKIVINPQFEAAFPFNGSGLAPVQSGKNWGFTDTKGKIIVNPQFDGALPFNGKYALILSGQKIGLIDKEGKFAVNPQFEGISLDLVQYLLFGKTEFSEVRTDFMNVSQEEKRVQDSIRVADSIALVQAEQQRIADSIAAVQYNRRR